MMVRRFAWCLAVLCALCRGAQTYQLRPAGPEIEAFVRDAIADRVRARGIPDFDVLGPGRRIAIRREMPQSGLTLGDAALPAVDGYEFALLSLDAAKAQAERTEQDVAFVTVDSALIAGDEAMISIGVDFVAPAAAGTVKMCCCEGVAQYGRRNGTWVFVRWKMTRCA